MRAMAPPAIAAIDHVALPGFDVGATRHFYAEVLGVPLVDAQSGSAAAWGGGEYLLMAFSFADGGVIDFFAFDGIARPPPDGLPKDLRHVALTVPTRAAVLAFKERFERAAIPHFTETHANDDLHVYVEDPNGTVLEIVAAPDGARLRPRDGAAAERTIARWLATRA
jgi:catechol 2,3-dioxygenase-like lactoylglutathione lyase family enzyme